jgi:hypothetical protein
MKPISDVLFKMSELKFVLFEATNFVVICDSNNRKLTYQQGNEMNDITCSKSFMCELYDFMSLTTL